MRKTKFTAPINDSACPAEWVACSIDVAALRKLSMKELWALRDGIHIMSEVLCGIRCQPRFDDAARDGYPNGAGSLLEKLDCWLGEYEQAITDVAKEAKPKTGDEAEWRGHLLVGYLADLNDSLDEVSTLAATAARDENRARFHDNYVGGAA